VSSSLGTADGKRTHARRRAHGRATASKFSGLVLAESMHSSGAAHMFEFTSGYLMSAGHGAVESDDIARSVHGAQRENVTRQLAIADGQQNESSRRSRRVVERKSPLTAGAARCASS